MTRQERRSALVRKIGVMIFYHNSPSKVSRNTAEVLADFILVELAKVAKEVVEPIEWIKKQGVSNSIFAHRIDQALSKAKEYTEGV